MPLLAEISDKMPTVMGTTVAACLIAGVAVGLGLIRPWLVLLPLPIVALYDLSMWAELHEPGFGGAIIRELGWSYVLGCFAGWNLPFPLAMGIVALRPRRYHDPGHCRHCGYDLTGNVSGRCPECGVAVGAAARGAPAHGEQR